MVSQVLSFLFRRLFTANLKCSPIILTLLVILKKADNPGVSCGMNASAFPAHENLMNFLCRKTLFFLHPKNF
jgi:hypothetical protein